MTNIKKRLRIFGVGDIMLGDHPIRIGSGVASQIKKQKKDYIFSKVSEEFKKADLVFGNLETILSSKDIISGNLQSNSLRGSESSVKSLVDAGFDVLNIANNHAMDHGTRPFLDTIDSLKSNNIKVIGISDSEENAVIKIKGIKLGIIGFSLRPDQSGNKVLYSNGSKEMLLEKVKNLKPNVDYILLSLHWGNEFVNIPSKDQIKLSHDLVDAGANIILGHHSHVMQGVEKYKGAIISYSLGNFVFDMWQLRTRISGIIDIKIEESGLDYEMIPVFIDSNFRPYLVDDKKAKRFTEYFDKISSSDVFDIESRSVSDYNSLVSRQREKYRSSIKIFFLSNIFNYRITYLYHFLKNFLYKKINFSIKNK